MRASINERERSEQLRERLESVALWSDLGFYDKDSREQSKCTSV